MTTADDPTGDSATDDGHRLRLWAVREQRESRVPGVVIGTARHGAVRGIAGVGLVDVEDHVDAASWSAFRIGSITKTFTAVVVLELVEEGLVELDAPVGRYLTGTTVGEVPIRSLLAHCGGLQREVPSDMWASMTGPDRDGLRAALTRVERVAEPWARWHYSNLGYAVLGQIAEEVTGRVCEAVIDARLLKPLGLSMTSWVRPSSGAVGYRVDPYADVVHREPDMDQGAVGVAGQLWSTAADLLAWGDALAGGAPQVVSPWVVEAMHTLQVMVDRSSWTSGWGLGLILERRGTQVTAGHTGAMPGFQAALCLDRHTRSVAVVLCNATRGLAAGQIAAEVVDDLIASTPTIQTPWIPTADIPADLDGVLGRWWSEADETIFTWRPTGLHALLVTGPASNETRFERVGVDSYQAVAGRLAGERLHVRRGADGGVTGLEWATYPFTRAPR